MSPNSAPLKGSEDPARLKACLTDEVRFSAVCVQQCTTLPVSVFQAGGVFFSPINLAWTKRDNQDAAPKTESASRGHPKRKGWCRDCQRPGDVAGDFSVESLAKCGCSHASHMLKCPRLFPKEWRGNEGQRQCARRSVFALRNRAETQGMIRNP